MIENMAEKSEEVGNSERCVRKAKPNLQKQEHFVTKKRELNYNIIAVLLKGSES